MYNRQDRESLRDALITAAREDPRITAAALTGSSAFGPQDDWSDIDLAFGVESNIERDGVVEEWTERMYREHGAVHHTDMVAGTGHFRVFLLRNTLQVDIAFWPEEDFGALAPTFRLLFGTAHDRPRPPAASFEMLVGMAWLHALHARSSIARARLWQAEYMVSGVRDHVLALACLRYGLSTSHGRGMDRLPSEVTVPLAGAVVRSLHATELLRAFGIACERLLVEIEAVDPGLAGRLAAPLAEIAGTTPSDRSMTGHHAS